MRNITLNAWDAIVLYNPPDCNGTSWQVHTRKGASGLYRSCTNEETTPSARISFTGVAVYYVSTFFDNQTMLFRLDGVPSPSISLAPPSNISANTNVTKVMWSREGLLNISHTLELFPGHTQSTLTFDTVIYTSNETVATSFSSTVSPSSIIGTTQRSAVDTQTAGMIFGSVVGSISGLILLGLTFITCRRRNQLNAVRHHRSSPEPPVLSRTQDFDDSQQEATQNYMMRFSDADLPSSSTEHASRIRPLPPIPEGASLAHSPTSHLDENCEDLRHFRAVAYASPDPTSNPDLGTYPDRQRYNETLRESPLLPQGGRVVSPSNLGKHVKLEPLRKATISSDKA